MAKVVAIGQPVNESEKLAIKYLRDNLPDTYTLYHNFEIAQGKEIYEVDLAIAAPHSLFLVDIKGISGKIDVYGNQWHPEGRSPIYSPLPKLRQNAKVLKTALIDDNPTITGFRNLYTHAVILMTAKNSLVDATGDRDEDNITFLDSRCLTYFKGKGHIPDRFHKDIRSFHGAIERTIRGKAKPNKSVTTYRDWQITDKLSQSDRYTEYRAKHSLLGTKAGTVRLRLYRVDPYEDQTIQDKQLNVISNAYRSVALIDSHPNILGVRDFFKNEDGDRFILVTEDIKGQALSLYIKKPLLSLTFDQKLSIIKDILTALDSAHKYEVVHRNLTPDVILIDAQAQAKLTGFDYARVTQNRDSTIAGEIVDDLDYSYHAPECYRDPTQASIASDLYSAGIIFYELLTKVKPFKDNSQVFDCDGIFPVKPSVHIDNLPEGMDVWLQKLCAFDPEERYPSAALALRELSQLITPQAEASPKESSTPVANKNIDLTDLAEGYTLNNRFIIQQKLGEPGGFGIAYKVMDTLGDVLRVMKLVTRDRTSVYQRLRQEYQTLLKVPDHPYVVKAVWADRLTDDKNTPYIVFEYVDGHDVEESLKQEALSLDDAVKIAQQTAEGLAHLHNNQVYHLDIKPSNLLWTEQGVKIIDFNVSVTAENNDRLGGGTKRYLPPDFDLNQTPNAQEKIDRDLYAWGITCYECFTGKYPFNGESRPPIGKEAADPRSLAGLEDLNPELVDILLQAIAPKRNNRFTCANEIAEKLKQINHYRNPPQPVALSTESFLPAFTPDKPNYNPFVTHLLTLYSQSQSTNAGTRGLDKISEATYVETLLDKELLTAILGGEFSLVMISGNAGDGKTAFIQKLEQYTQENGSKLEKGANGSIFTFNNRQFLTNYDGSQDEGDKTNKDVLLEFFAPYQGTDETVWQSSEVRLIAINEGRLVDFLDEYRERFPRLITIVQQGLKGNNLAAKTILINLNLRSVVADLGENNKEENNSIYDRLIRRFTKPEFWQACSNCDLQNKCYIYHNAQTFGDRKMGAKVIARLKTLYTLTHFRSRLHITLRDLRSALAYMLVGTKDCDGVHQLYNSNDDKNRQEILDGFYFNAWMGGSQGSSDRFLTLLRDIDVGEVNNANLDRQIAFLEPNAKQMGQFSFDRRHQYANDLLTKEFRDLNQDLGDRFDLERFHKHRNYVATLRRRYYFECRGEMWQQMLPYHRETKDNFLNSIKNKLENPTAEISNLVTAINRGEGLRNPQLLAGNLALRVRQVPKGTIRSYRLFDISNLSLSLPPVDSKSDRFIQYLPQTLILIYDAPTGYQARLTINLDIYEMLNRLNRGYRPSIEEKQGFYRSLSVFKNMLASAPYQEVLLTETGQDFYQVKRHPDGKLAIDKLIEEEV